MQHDGQSRQRGASGGLVGVASDRSARWRVLVLGLLVVAIPAALAIGVDQELGLAAFRQHHLELLGFVAVKPALAALLFMLAYGAAVAVSLPGVALMTMAGGFLFGWLEATLYALIAATVATSAVFVFARGTLADMVDARCGSSIWRFAERYKRNALTYTIVLNLAPIFPYGMVVTLPAACGVGLPTFAAGAFLGLAPATMLFAHLGEDLGYIVASGHALDVWAFLTPEILVTVGGLLALCLMPLGLRKLDLGRSG